MLDVPEKFSSTYNTRSVNRVRSLSRDEKQEIATILYHYRQITKSPERLQSAATVVNPHLTLRGNLNQARGILKKAFHMPAEVKGSKEMMPAGINTMPREKLHIL